MSLNTFQFFIFFLFTISLYYLVPHRFQRYVLLIASIGFYMIWNRLSTVFLCISIISTYCLSKLVLHEKKHFRKKVWLLVCLILNIGLLCGFKYFNLGSHISFAVPVGISFYTFKVISFLMDSYYGVVTDSSFVNFSLYTLYFPQIISGPISRYNDFSKQIEYEHSFETVGFSFGFSQFIIGVFQKIVIADRIGILVDTVFNNIQNHSCFDIWVAVFAFTFQIYFDFSGYSDMAIGVSNMLGIETMPNFDRPYWATSIGDFWRRWHISLSSWFRDYVYIPLGGSRCSIKRWAINIMVVFLLSGLWHGGDVTFFIWGGLHGLYQVVGRLLKKYKKKGLIKAEIKESGANSTNFHIIDRLFTFLLVTFAWSFFRADSLNDSIIMLQKMFSPNLSCISFELDSFGIGIKDGIFSILLIFGWFALEAKLTKKELLNKIKEGYLPIRWAVYLLLIFTTILFGVYGDLTEKSYIYFQF